MQQLISVDATKFKDNGFCADIIVHLVYPDCHNGLSPKFV